MLSVENSVSCCLALIRFGMYVFTTVDTKVGALYTTPKTTVVLGKRTTSDLGIFIIVSNLLTQHWWTGCVRIN